MAPILLMWAGMGVRRSQIEFAASCALFAAILLALIIAALVLDPLSASVP